MVKIAPSILAADFLRLGEDIASISTADYLHFDVMDGVFVPNISFGMPVISCVKGVTELPLDVHLMITKPLRYVRRFAELGADIIVFHTEADEPQNILEAVKLTRSLGSRVGLAVKPATPAAELEGYLELIDLALVMTVEPGFGGQSFMSDMLPKVEALRRSIDRLGLDVELEVDGGINRETARLCRDSGATVLVAGSDVFRADDRALQIKILRGEV